MDVGNLSKWDDYSEKLKTMMQLTHTKSAPWTVVRSNDKRRARLETIRTILLSIDYTGKDLRVIGKADDKIIGQGPKLLS